MFTIRTGKLVAVVSVALLGVACSREQQDWRMAESADTIEAYDQFIEHHPDSELVREARSRVAQLGEERDWHEAGTVDTVDAYRQFLSQHPNGKWAQEARTRIESFALGGQIEGPSAGSPAAAASLIRAAKTAAAAPASRAVSPSPGTASASVSVPRRAAVSPPAAVRGGASSGVQLGAFNTEAGARKEWESLESKFVSQLKGLGPHVVAVDMASGRLYRLQAIVRDEEQARALCDSLRKRGQSCMTVQLH
ncbi:MAG TPA: SPOR domain-containing protein [Steroidobacteraceae bacterium]|nr:SPOR domain-containing protein [Steroidobacteraceae bacterium]